MRIQTNLRISADLREQLKEAADQSGRSVNKEIEARLTHSVRAKRYWEKMDDPQAAAVAELVKQVMFVAGQNAGTFAKLSQPGGEHWYSNPYAFDQVAKAVARIFEIMRPLGDVELPEHPVGDHSQLFASIGATIANGLAKEVVSGERLPPERRERADDLRRTLGDEIVQRMAERLKV